MGSRPPLPPPPPRAPAPGGDGDELVGLWEPRPEESQLDDFALRLDAATANLEEVSLGALDGSDDPSRLTELPGAPPPAATPDPTPDHGDVASLGPSHLDVDQGGLQLDLERAGLRADQARGQALPAQRRPGAIAAQAPQAEIAAAASQGLALPLATRSPDLAVRLAAGPDAEGPGLLGDRWVALLGGIAIGLLVGLWPASRSADRLHERASAELYEELERAVAQPLAVRAGTVRAPEAVAAEIRGHHDEARNRFLLVWLGAALPISLGLGLALGWLGRRRG